MKTVRNNIFDRIDILIHTDIRTYIFTYIHNLYKLPIVELEYFLRGRNVRHRKGEIKEGGSDS